MQRCTPLQGSLVHLSRTAHVSFFTVCRRLFFERNDDAASYDALKKKKKAWNSRTKRRESLRKEGKRKSNDERKRWETSFEIEESKMCLGLLRSFAIGLRGVRDVRIRKKN